MPCFTRYPGCLAVLVLPALAACMPDAPPPNAPAPATVVVVVVPGPGAAPQPPPAPLKITGGPEPSHAGPVHLWRFDEPSGGVARDDAGSEHGELGAGVARVPGCSGYAVDLSGDARSVVDLGRSAAAFGRRDFTVSLFFRTTTKKSNNELLSNRAAGSHGNFFNLRFAASGLVVYEVDDDGTNYVALKSRSGLADGLWHHAAARRRGPVATLFIDGAVAEEGRSPAVTNLDNGRPLEIGGSSIAAEYDLYFRGAVDEVAIFDRALGDGEIAALALGPGGCRPGAR
jgi:Concanavalin A-like lectin/glucanases superfamily